MRLILDTNIILDMLLKRNDFEKESKAVFQLAIYGIIDAYVTSHTIATVYYILENSKVTEPRKQLEKLMAVVGVLDVNGDDCEKALKSDVADYEDGLICESAKRNNIDVIVTRNEKDFTKSGMIIYTPDEILAKHKQGK